MSSTAFSYAQAAKGHTIPQPSPQLTSSSAPPSVKDDVPTASTSVTAPSVASNEADARDSDKTSKSEIEEPSAKQDVEVASVGGSGSSTASVTGQSVKTGQESDITMVEFQHLVEEKGSRSTSRTSQGPDGGKKGRKGRKGRANDKDAQGEQNLEDEKEADISKPALSEAPLPAVNYWTKRLEAQSAAKAKHAPVAPANGVSNPVSAGQEAKKRQAQEAGAANGEHVNGTKDNSHKKPSELSQGADHAPRRSAPRGSRANDKDDKSIPALPSVADALFWPDPKSAATTTEEGIRKVQEKTDAAEKEGQEESGTNKKKNWVNLDIVPTVVFNTPLPTRGGTKTRGGTRGGRESGSARGGHGAAPSSSASGPGTDRPTVASGSAGPKAAVTRPREGSIQSRTASQSQPAVPHVAKDAVSKDQRKPTNSSAAEHARDSAPDTSSASNKRASSMRDIRTELGGAANFEPSNALSRNTQDRANGNHQQYPVREGRSDRGRGNGYRGRGGHNNGAGSHMQSSSFAVNGQQYGTYPSRHNSAAPSPPPYGGQFPMSFTQPHRGRGNKWPGLGQTSGRNVANGTSFAIKPAQATDFPVPQYGAYMFPLQMDPLVPVIKTQVEYYLSVENLCKDRYLRQQMDSQGFVKFSTIAGFKRMRELVKDHDLIRMACSSSETIDYGVGDDNIERLRMHDLWHSFVLPYEERSEDAQNEGPAVFTPWYQIQAHSYGGPVIHPGYPAPSSAGLYSGFPDDRMFQPVYGNGAHYEHAMNGTGDLNGHRYGPESQLSAVVPEYSPPMSPLTLESMTNFTDAQVEKMMVVLGFDNHDSSSPCDVADRKVYLADDAVKNGANGAYDSTDSPSTDDAIVNDSDAEPSPSLKQLVRQPYNEIRRVALEKRGGASPGETPVPMRNLYQFWSQMLLKDFNSNVYTEFRELALDDIRRDVPARDGLKYLLEFYEKLLLDTDGQKPWPQGRAIPGIFQLHFQEALEFERTIGSRPDATI